MDLPDLGAPPPQPPDPFARVALARPQRHDAARPPGRLALQPGHRTAPAGAPPGR